MDWRKIIGELWPGADVEDPEVQKLGRRAFLLGTAATAVACVVPTVLDAVPDFHLQVPENLTAKECDNLFSAVRGENMRLRVYLDGLRRRPVA
jgi:hypothetical protein